MSHHQLSMCTSTPRYSESSLSLKLYLHSFLLRAYETVYESDKEIYGEPDIVNNPLTDMQDLEDCSFCTAWELIYLYQHN